MALERGTRCGDGTAVPEFGEVCDDGDRDDCTGDCAADCTRAITGCGDGVVCGPEACDDQGESERCTASCELRTCGEGKIDEGEVCDDGNREPGDGCRSNCDGAERCGDGLLDPAAGEVCDDGNVDDGDGCDAQCVAEAGCRCDVPGQGCTAAFHSANDYEIIWKIERVRTGAVIGGVVQYQTYTWGLIEDIWLQNRRFRGSAPRWRLRAVPTRPGAFAIVGGGRVIVSEGGHVDTRSVSTHAAQLEAPEAHWLLTHMTRDEHGARFSIANAASGLYLCSGAPRYGGPGADRRIELRDAPCHWLVRGTTAAGACVWGPFCGNGGLDVGEACDDGNTEGGDGCSADCRSDETCGNGVQDPGEQCDDGGERAGDGCSPRCLREECGNGVLDPGETCDDGNTEGGDGCSADCASDETCGNGVVDPRETCDDGADNRDSWSVMPGCATDCKGAAPHCGDGLLAPEEVCDDGNTESGDGCAADCRSDETCGNGVRDVWEYCDDGNTQPADGCAADCLCHPSAELCDGVDNDCDGRVDNGCPTALLFSARELRARFGGPNARRSYTDECPAGQVLRGLSGAGGKGGLWRVQGRCGRLRIVADASELPHRYRVRVEPGRDLPVRGVYLSEPVREVLCPADHVVIGIEGRAATNEIQAISLLCAPLELVGDGGGYALAFGASQAVHLDTPATGGAAFRDAVEAPALVTTLRSSYYSNNISLIGIGQRPAQVDLAGSCPSGACVCAPTARTEGACGDGLDNDCDALLDCADPECSGALSCE